MNLRNYPEVFKFGTFGIAYTWYVIMILESKVIGQSYRVTKCKNILKAVLSKWLKLQSLNLT